MARYSYYSRFPEYVPVAVRRARAAKAAARMAKGRTLSPVVLSTTGRAIAKSFWGKAWCDNLESYSDYSNRMPRGRTYVRAGAVVDLQIQPGKVLASVAGTSLYRIEIGIGALDAKRWRSIVAACSGRIDSLVDLLQGKLSDAVLEALVDPERGLFPSPREIKLSCSCPDWATMCKHVAATLYGVGARLDERPELFFTLRQVDQADLVAEAAALGSAPAPAGSGKKRLAEAQLESVFGIELDEEVAKDAHGTASVAVADATPRPVGAGARRGASSGRIVRACKVPGCGRPSKGPRFRYLCVEHRSLPTATRGLEEARAGTAGAARRGRVSLVDGARAFREAAINGHYYESFRVSSRNFMEKSGGTLDFTRDLDRLLERCAKAAPTSPAPARQAFDLLFDVVRRIADDTDSIIFFADEAGIWQLGVDWLTVLPAYFACLAATALDHEFAQDVDLAIMDFAEEDRARLLRAARRVATADQKRALRLVQAARQAAPVD